MDLMNPARRKNPCREKMEQMSFLVVDDERLMQVMIRQTLRDMGAVNIRFASSGFEAYQMLKIQPADVVITDWYMPQMTGVELLQQIKNDADLFQTLVLILSGESAPLWFLFAVEEGVDGFLLKPFTQKSLMQSLIDLLQKSLGSGKRKIDDVIRLKLLGHYQEAVELGEQLLDELDDTELFRTLAECHYEMGEYNKALEKVQAAGNMGKQNSKDLNLIGKIHMKKKEHEEAISAFKQAADMNSLNTGRNIELAMAMIRAGKIAEGKRELDELSDEKLTDMDYVGIGACYLLCNEVKRAYSYLKMAHNPFPHTAKIYNACAGALWKMDCREEAVRLYKRCVKMDPDYSAAHYNLGLSYCFLESYDKAKESLECALHLHPGYEKAKDLLKYITRKQS